MNSLGGGGGLGGFAGQRGPTGLIGNKTPSGYKSGQFAQFTPEQMQLFQQLFSNVSPESFTSRLAGGDESIFNEIEAPALRQFSGLQGNLASRFSGMGTGARRSSGFQNAAGQQASDFALQLQSQRQGLQRQAIMDLMGLSENLLSQRPYEQFLVPKQKKSSGFGGAIGAGLGGIGGFFAGGPAGALQGAQLGYGIGSAF
jgi:hypothetical protein